MLRQSVTVKQALFIFENLGSDLLSNKLDTLIFVWCCVGLGKFSQFQNQGWAYASQVSPSPRHHLTLAAKIERFCIIAFQSLVHDCNRLAYQNATEGWTQIALWPDTTFQVFLSIIFMLSVWISRSPKPPSDFGYVSFSHFTKNLLVQFTEFKFLSNKE